MPFCRRSMFACLGFHTLRRMKTCQIDRTLYTILDGSSVVRKQKKKKDNGKSGGVQSLTFIYISGQRNRVRRTELTNSILRQELWGWGWGWGELRTV